MKTGDRIKLDFDTNGFSAGEVVEYIAATSLTGGVDLADTNFADAAKWKRVTGKPAEVYEFKGATGSVNLGTENYSNAARWTKISGSSPTDLIPGLSLSPSESNASAFGFLVVRTTMFAATSMPT